MALYQIDLCKISLHFEGEKVKSSIFQVIYESWDDKYDYLTILIKKTIMTFKR